MSSRISRAAVVTALGLSCLTAAVRPAHAALGGSPMTPPADATSTTTTVSPNAVMHSSSTGTSATSTTRSSTSYSIRETTLGNGDIVREYLATDGTVFGLAWHGPQMPNLSSLLGTYFAQYLDGVKAARAARGGHGPVAVDQSSLVVRSGGHMGSFTGQAWLPQALPAGVSGSDIQ